jgi:LPS-assembly lipoprotein
MAVSRRDFNRSLLLVVPAAMASCGFRPRGSQATVGDVGRVYVDADRGVSIAPYLRDALARRDFDLAQNRDSADVFLRVTDEQIAERIVSVQSSGRVSEFELSHTVALVVQRADAGQVSEEDAERQANLVRVTREYTYDETEVLGKQNEARILREELREELVMQIVLRTLASLADSVA